jgi:uncharacterized protein YqeY
MIIKEIEEKLKTALKTNDTLTKNILRNIKTKITEYLVQNKLPRDSVEDAIVIKVVSANKKALQKAIELLEQGGDKAKDLIDDYNKEIAFCDQYIPKQLTEEELKQLVAKLATENNITNAKETGKLIGIVMKNTVNIDGNTIRKYITDYFSDK